VRKLLTFGICGGPLLLLFILSVNTEAIPTFARKYQTSCSTCHYAFPKLNKFGRAYANNGFRYPGDDKDYAKEEAVSLGSDAQKKVFPEAIWPTDIPGQPPVSFRWISRMHYQPDEKGNEFTFENPHEFEVFTAGTIGDDMSFFFELEWEHVGEFGYGGWLDYKFSDPFHLRLGNIDFMPFHDGQRLTREHYNYGVFAEKEGDGILLWGAANGPSDKGGFKWETTIFNGENDGGDNIDLNSSKDVFASASYKIGGMGVLGSTGASETSAFWKDDFAVTLGGFGHFGKSEDQTKRRNFGGIVDFFADDLNVFSFFMLSQEQAQFTPEYVDSKRAFLEADYVVYPWLIPLVRYEYTEPDQGDVVRRIVPAVVFMVRANMKLVPTGRIDLDNSDLNRYNLEVDVAF
jgi:hypothetical protein